MNPKTETINLENNLWVKLWILKQVSHLNPNYESQKIETRNPEDSQRVILWILKTVSESNCDTQ